MGRQIDSYDTNVSHHEQSLLAALVSGRVPFQDVAEIVKPADFVGDGNDVAFACLRDIASSGVPLALSTIVAEMRSRDILDRFGGNDGLSALAAQGRVSAAAVVHHASEVAEAGRKRRLRSALLEAADDCHTEQTAEKIVHFVSAKLRDLTPVNQDDYYTAGEAAEAALSEIVQAWTDSAQVGLPSGLRDLDAHIGGFRPGQMIVLAARPSIGKSCVGAEIAQRVAERGDCVLFANLEMSKPEMGTRFLSRLSGVPSNLLQSPKQLTDSDISRLSRASKRIANTPLILWGGSGRSIDQLSAAARRFHARTPLAMLVIDYLGLIRGDGKSRYEQVSMVSQQIKSLAIELKIPILTLCQLNRDSEKNNREPCLADLRDSGAIEQDADIVIFIVRDRDSEDCTLTIAKFRNGQIGAVKVRFEGAFSRISDRVQEQAWQP